MGLSDRSAPDAQLAGLPVIGLLQPFQCSPQRGLRYIQLPRYLPEGYSLGHQFYSLFYRDLSPGPCWFSTLGTRDLRPWGSPIISFDLTDSLDSYRKTLLRDFGAEFRDIPASGQPPVERPVMAVTRIGHTTNCFKGTAFPVWRDAPLQGKTRAL